MSQRAPVGSSTTFVAVVAAASTSSSSPAPVSNATSVIIGVTVSVGSVVLLVVAFRIWRCTRPPKAPLPPKGPLAHDRQRHVGTGFSESEFQSSLPIRAQGIVPLAKDAQNAPYTNYPRQTGSRTDVASISPSSPSVVSSQAHLVSESDENAEIRRGRRPSVGSPSNAVRHHHGYRSRTISNTGSVRSTRSRQSSQGTIRGPPHHRPVNIVLPQPLAPGLYNTSTLRQPRMHHARDYARERRSESREREYRSGRVSMDGSSSSAHESGPTIPLCHEAVAYPPPGPSICTENPTAPSTPRPQVSNPQSADVSSSWSPHASVPFLTRSTPSPDHGSPPLPPPKDFPPHHSSRPRRNSESAAGRQRL